MKIGKIHTTNYYNTFIEVAQDCPVDFGELPKGKGKHKTVVELQYEILIKNPYCFTSDEVIFNVFAVRNDIVDSEYEKAKNQFFSKGQACFRASPLCKRYGFGIHSNGEGKIALYGRETEAYEQFLNNPKIKKVKAMRTSKNKN